MIAHLVYRTEFFALRRGWALVAVAILVACQGHKDSGGKDSQLLTATEVFNLRSKCAELGATVTGGEIIDPRFTESKLSHYDPHSNRCYVEVNLTEVASKRSRAVLIRRPNERAARVSL